MTKQQKVLVFLFGSLGDTIVAIPSLRAVRSHFADAEIVLLQNVHPNDLVTASEVIPGSLIDRYMSYRSNLNRFDKIAGFCRLWKELRREHFDAVVYLGISERPKNSIIRDKRFFRSCGIRKQIGFHAFSKEELYPVDIDGRPAMTEHESVRSLIRLKRDGVAISEDYLRAPFFSFSAGELEPIKKWLNSHRTNPDSRLIAIAPGCKTLANVWPLENFIELGRKMTADKNCEIVIVGGRAETELGRKMVEAMATGINAAGDFSVKESAMLLSLCDLYIGLDTGTTHLAVAVGTSCFAIYGQRNNPGHWYPMGEGHMVIRHPVECAGCALFECNLLEHPCMNGISVDSVLRSLETFTLKVRKQEVAGVELISV